MEYLTGCGLTKPLLVLIMGYWHRNCPEQGTLIKPLKNNNENFLQIYHYCFNSSLNYQC